MTEMERLTDEIFTLREAIGKLAIQVGVLASKAHTTSDCSLSAKVEQLRLSEARRGGMLAVVGVLAGLVASGIVSLLTRVTWPK